MKMINKYMKNLLLALLLLTCTAPTSARHYTVVVSLDGYRWDYPQWYDTPFIDFMASKGVASGLIPSYPSKTFPNHYTIATGLYPDHHGIVANEFYDPATRDSFSLARSEQKTNPGFYGGEPIWNTAQRQGKRVAVFYWPGSDVKVNGHYPSRFFEYDKKPRLSMSERLDGALEELRRPEKKRPDLIMAYLEQPDANGHTYGPHHKKTRKAVLTVDSLLQSFYQGVRALPHADSVNLIVLSDHGMAWVEQRNNIGIKGLLKPEWVTMISGSVPCNIYAKEGCTDSIYHALKPLNHAQVWRKQDIPSYLHYGSNARVGDIVVNPDIGYVVYDGDITAGGTHGYDPTLQEMHAVFRAVGPDFKHIWLPHFENINIYPLLCKLLGIVPAGNDGNLENVEMMMK
ncbi:type I phosphodiesterase / nucleotide pyrophosphatase [Bacteroidales bacterium KA00344]|nr:type I phosphodiesterase / nucleotide pyrophosphatase [Bacteroidales bacterium KA00344]